MKTTRLEMDGDIRAAVQAAAKWYVRLNSDKPPESLEKEWQHWLAASPENKMAWQEIESIQCEFNQVPKGIVSPILKQANLSRREVLKRLAVIAAVTPLSWLTYQASPWKDWEADYHTAIGQRQTFTLMDGSSLALNTNSSADVSFTAVQRLIQLHQGEVLIATAKTKNHATKKSRAFKVQTPQGLIHALGTRFIVHIQGEQTNVTVLEKAVRIKPVLAPHKEIVIRAGQQLSFTKNHVGKVLNAEASAGSWLYGSLIVVNMPLGELISELSRYRQGILTCDDAIKHIKISGAFPLGDTDRALQAISDGFSVRQSRLTDFWVSIIPT
jgi:transmembrane sensor